MRLPAILVAALLALVGIAAFLSLFIIKETEQALVLQFGAPIKTISEPGLNFKAPWQNVVFIDKRILDLDSPPQELIASDQKRLVVDAFARYRILDPLQFYITVNNQGVANQRLSTLLNSNIRAVLAEEDFFAVVRDKREELMARITQRMDQQAREFGIRIVDVRIRRADLPEANSQAVFSRMQTEREQEAAEIRAIGNRDAQEIRAEADKQVTVTLADADRISEIVRGEGDACRNRIFAEAFGQDLDFFSFYRSMQSYERALEGTGTAMVLSPDSEFFRYLRDPSGGESGQLQVRPTGSESTLKFDADERIRDVLCPEILRTDIADVLPTQEVVPVTPAAIPEADVPAPSEELQ